MSQRLILPREWTQKTIAPIWKAAAISGWAFALILAQCLVLVLARPGRPPAPPPPPPAVALPAPQPKHEEVLVANSMVRIRCLVKVGRSQEALAEIIRCLSLCQRTQTDPPVELPELFAAMVSSPSARSAGSAASHPRPNPLPPTPPDEVTTSVAGRLPGPAYPLAHPRTPRLASNPPPIYPEAPFQIIPPDSAPYPYQPPFGPGMEPPGAPPYPAY